MRIFGLDIRRAPTPADLLIEQRSETAGLANPPAWLREALGAYSLASGVSVTEESAMRIAAVYSCVRVLAESISSLPFKLYRRNGRIREVATDHPLYRVLHHQGNDLMTAMQVREVMMVHLALWGNAYAEKVYDGRGYVVELWPIHPGRVRPVKDGTTVKYQIQGVERALTRNEIFHIPGLGFDGLIGKSPIRLHREGLGVAVAAQHYGAKFFANDARPGVVLKHPGSLSDEGFEKLRRSWADAHQGATNAYKAAILEEGMDVATVGLPPEDAQFIETRKYERSEIASIYRVPPHLIGDLEKATFSNIEHQSIEFVVHTLRPWLVRFEQAVQMQLLTQQEQREYFAEHVVDGLLRGDAKSRFESYAVARNWGWLSANDIRELENLNPIDGGDIYLQPLNMVPAGSDLAADERSVCAQTLEGRSEKRTSVPSRVASAKALEPVYLDTFKRIVKREVSEIRKALKSYLEGGDKDGFRSWMESFAEEHAGWMAKRLQPAFQSMADAMLAAAADEIDAEITSEELSEFVQSYTEASAARHAGSARGQIESLLEEEDAYTAIDTRLGEWDETRAEKLARRERQRSSNAFTKAAWIAAGIATLTWRTAGDTCPICREMNGRTSIITAPFLAAGSSIGGLITSGNVGHPPLHDGCDCYMEPGIGRKRLSDAELRSAFDTIINEPEHDHAHA